MTPRICDVPDCDHYVRDERECTMHAQRRRKYGSYELPKRPTEEERFWGKVERSDSCWRWQGSTNAYGYGHFTSLARTYPAHRYAYALVHGVIPDGLVIDHKCHNRACVNPGHLQAVTPKQNSENRAGPTILSTTGYLGVDYVRRTGRFRARVDHRHLGYFDTAEEANDAAVAGRLELYTNNLRDRAYERSA